MSKPMHLKRSASLKKFPQRAISSLETRKVRLTRQVCRHKLAEYKRRYRKQRWLVLFCCWMVVPVFWWRRRRERLPEYRSWIQAREQLQKQAGTRWWHWLFWWKSDVAVESRHLDALLRFYQSLSHALRQFNSRLDLFDYALERQNKRLDPPFTVGEYEQIELTFQRISDELASAQRLIQITDQHADIDLGNLLADQASELNPSAEYIANTVEMGQTGQFVQDLLVLEADLRKELGTLSGLKDTWKGFQDESA